MFNKTLKKLSASWQGKYLENMDQTAEYYKKFQDVEYIWNVPFDSQDGTSLAMDLFRPKDMRREPLPVVLTVHGGGLFMGDRRMEMGLCRHFAQAGFLAASIEYRVFPQVDVRGAILDLAGGMEEIGRIASNYGGDPNRIYLVAESAGVFASIFAAVMTRSEQITEALGGRNPGVHIRAMAALSGMFYARRKDLIGLVMRDNIIPKVQGNEKYAELMNTELDEVVDSLPPMLLVSSKGDFLRKYTLRYSDFLREHQREYRLIYYENGKHLPHAFPSLAPELPESIAVDQLIVQWFLEH